MIVRSPSSGWHCFSSKHLHGGAEHEGLRIASEGEHAGKIVERQADGSDLRPLDLSITKVVAGLLINSLIVVLIVLGVARCYRGRKADSPAPRGFVGLFESLVESLVDDIIAPCVGANYRRFAPYLLTVFFFIFVNNLMGLIPFFPGGANVTGNIAVTLVWLWQLSWLSICSVPVIIGRISFGQTCRRGLKSPFRLFRSSNWWVFSPSPLR